MDSFEPTFLSKDDAFDCVRSERRRTTIAVLLEESRAWNVVELAREVAARDADVAPADVDEKTVERYHTAFVHQDLPKLADLEVVVYDRAEETVEPGRTIDDLAPLV